jgi:hypothetical protein
MADGEEDRPSTGIFATLLFWPEGAEVLSGLRRAELKLDFPHGCR